MPINLEPKDEELYLNDEETNFGCEDSTETYEPSETEEGLTIKSAKEAEEVILLDNMTSHSATGPRFRWSLFIMRVKAGTYKGQQVILPLNFKSNSNNARRYLERAGLRVNVDYSILRQEMPSGEVNIGVAFV